MTAKCDVSVLLSDISEQIEIILEASQSLSYDDFVEQRILQNGFIRCLEVIGEATKKLPSEFRMAHPEIPWRLMAGMRDRMIHGYSTVDLDEVWKTVTEDIPILHTQIRSFHTQNSEGRMNEGRMNSEG